LGAKPQSPTGNETRKIYALVCCQFLVAKISTLGPRKWEIFWADPKFWGPLAPPPKGVGGRGSCRLVDVVGGKAHKNFGKNLTRGFRAKSTRKIFPQAGNALVVNKKKNQTRIIKSSTNYTARCTAFSALTLLAGHQEEHPV